MPKDLTPDQAIEALRKLPEDKQRLVLGKLPPDTLKAIRSRLNEPSKDLTTNTINPKTGTGYGLYRMIPESNQGFSRTEDEVSVPFNRVEDALKSGLHLHPDEQSRYEKDKAHPDSGPGVSKKIENFLNTPAVRPKEGTPEATLHGGIDPDIENAAKAAGRVVYGTPGFLRDLADAAIHMGKSGQGHSDFLSLVDPGNVPVQLQSQFREDMKKDPSLAVDNLLGSLAGMGLVSAVTHGASKVIPKVAGMAGHAVGERVRGEIRETLGVPENTERIADKFGNKSQRVNDINAKREQRFEGKKTAEQNKADEANAAAQKKYEEEKAEAEHATQGREIAHKYDVHEAAQEAAAKHKQATADVESHNARVHSKALEKFTDEAQKVRADNQLIMDKYAEEKTKTEEENKAAEHALELRRSEEEGLQKYTEAYYAKEDTVGAKVKADANAKWAPVHQSLDAETIDGGVIEAPLQKIMEISPEVRREVRQLIPEPEDADANSQYVQERNKILKELGHTQPDAYENMDEFNKQQIDRFVAERGFTPDPIELDPQPGVEIPFDKIHRAQSIIGRNIRNGRYGYEGPLLGEMKQLAKILYDAESQIASNNGKTADLNAARKATREYQEAFGRARNTPKTQSDLRKQQANPEQFKEENEQERVDAAKKHDPSLAEDYAKIRARREAIKKLPSEDQLRKSIQQIPQPPTVGDLRSGYSLKPNPVYEPPTVGDLRPGYELKPKPELPPAASAKASVKLPERVPVPEPPSTIEPKAVKPPEQIPNPDTPNLQAENVKFINSQLRKYGRWGQWAVRMIVGVPIVALQHGTISSFGEGIVGGQFSVTLLSRALRSPTVLEWLAKPSAEDMKMIATLPTAEAERMREVLNKLADEDKRQNPELAKVKIAPIMAAFLSGKASGNPSVSDIRKEAEGKKPTPPRAQSSVTPEELKKKAQSLGFHVVS